MPKPTDSSRNEQKEQLSIEDFDYELPDELIAQVPLEVRHKSRLLVLDKRSGAIEHRFFHELPELLRPKDLVVVNNTSVIPARLIANRKSGGQIRLLLLRPHTPASSIWEALVSPIKRLKPGEILLVAREDGSEYAITVKDIVIGHDGFKRLLVDLGESEHVFPLLSQLGQAPLPPYIQRKDRGQRKMDLDRYQTVFASQPGAVAAPTAGLHFSQELIANLNEAGIELCQITLHVGAGTFKPIATTLDEHTIEPELMEVSEETANKINTAREENRRIIAVGTTSLRALESAGSSGVLTPVDWQNTSLYIKPGHQFQIADGMITNFHLSRSSLLVLVAALAGRDRIMSAYKEAVEKRYRFFSYGDAMLII